MLSASSLKHNLQRHLQYSQFGIKDKNLPVTGFVQVLVFIDCSRCDDDNIFCYRLSSGGRWGLNVVVNLFGNVKAIRRGGGGGQWRNGEFDK